MSETNATLRRWRRQRWQWGATAIEVAWLSPLFFALVFGVIELARLMFVFNTLQEVTRRAAAAAVNVDPNDTSAINSVKINAIFRTAPGSLTLAPEITDNNVRIDYLSLARASDGSLTILPIPQASLPSSPARNRQNCMANPNGANCIRFVRVEVCDTANTSGCNAVKSTISYVLGNFTVNLPKATTISPSESLGYAPGMSP